MICSRILLISFGVNWLHSLLLSICPNVSSVGFRSAEAKLWFMVRREIQHPFFFLKYHEELCLVADQNEKGIEVAWHLYFQANVITFDALGFSDMFFMGFFLIIDCYAFWNWVQKPNAKTGVAEPDETFFCVVSLEILQIFFLDIGVDVERDLITEDNGWNFRNFYQLWINFIWGNVPLGGLYEILVTSS